VQRGADEAEAGVQGLGEGDGGVALKASQSKLAAPPASVTAGAGHDRPATGVEGDRRTPIPVPATGPLAVSTYLIDADRRGARAAARSVVENGRERAG
jgi:hypothetical protein